MTVNHLKSDNMEEMLMVNFSSDKPVTRATLQRKYTDDCIERAVKLEKIRVYDTNQYGETRYIRNK